MTARKLIFMVLLLAGLFSAGCSTTDILSTESLEERVWGRGYAVEMYRYGHQMELKGRYQEALAAFTSAELAAYTQAVREDARRRRIWLESYIRARQQGEPPPPRPHQLRTAATPPPRPPSAEVRPPLPPVTATPLPQDGPARGGKPLIELKPAPTKP